MESNKLQTRDEMLQKYEAHSAADYYLFGFELDGELYCYKTSDLSDVNNALKLDRAASSKGGMLKIRIRFGSFDKARLARKSQKLGKISVMAYADKYNNGHHFEHYIHELNGKSWAPDSVPFNVAGDIEIDGKQVQIKFDGAELTNEKVLARV